MLQNIQSDDCLKYPKLVDHRFAYREKGGKEEGMEGERVEGRDGCVEARRKGGVEARREGGSKEGREGGRRLKHKDGYD